MNTARFRFHGVLSQFLPRQLRNEAFPHTCARAATLKNAIEALGVPHTEAARVLVNGAPATLDRIVREGDAVEVFPWETQPLADPPRFLADAHLGGLARFLRMLGYDTAHENHYADERIRALSVAERRVVLTRDRELLKCRDIFLGCYVRELKAEAQLREVAARFDLAAHARPFTLCLRCDLPLESIEKEKVLERLPASVAASQERFLYCDGCGRIYWEGTHFARMRAALGRMLPG